MTREEALQLRCNTWLYHRRLRQGARKEPLRVRVTGQVRTWKRDQNRIEIPVKWGMHASGCGTITASDLADWFTTESEALANSDQAKAKRTRASTAPHGRCARTKHCVEHDQDSSVLPCRCRYCGSAFAVDRGRGLVWSHSAADIAQHEQRDHTDNSEPGARE